MNLRGSRGFAFLPVILLVGLLVSGFGAWEIHKAREKNTAKAVVTTVADVKVVATSNDADNKARDAKEAAQLATDQAAAGFLSGALFYYETDPSPIPQRLVGDAAKLLPPATSAQEQGFHEIVTQMKAKNDAALAAKEAQITQLTGDLKAATAVAAQTRKEKDDAIAAASKSAADVEVIHISAMARLKAWFLGLGLLGIGGVIVICAVLPILAQAFPILAPAIKSLTSWILGFWHQLAAKTEAELLLVKTRLESEVAAHNDTKATLVKIATAP